MRREFFNKVQLKDYIKNYFKVMAISLVLAIAAFIRIYSSDWELRKELSFILVFVYPILLILAAIIHYNLQKNLKYIFTDDLIIESRNGQENKHFLSDIKDISRPKIEKNQKTGIDYIKIKFHDGDTITFVNTLPYYNELETFLVKYFKEKLDYYIRQV